MADELAVVPELDRLFIPGPVGVRAEVLQAQVGALMGHRTPEMEALMQRIQPGLRAIFRTTRPVYIAPSSGTGMMEAGVRNAARRRVLSLVNGAFSERFARIAASNGLEVDRLEVDWGENHTPQMVAEALTGKDYDAVTVVHSETSTGVLNPVREIAGVVHAAGDVVLLVDTVSSMAGAPVEIDAWGLDYVLTASQKALAVPPGLGLAVAQPGILERAGKKKDRGYYYDLLAFEKNIEKHQTPNTPAITLMYALAVQVQHITEETIEARWRRHREMAARTYAWVDDMQAAGVPVSVLAAQGYRSPTVSCIVLPDGRTGPDVCAAVRERAGYIIAPGYGKTKERMIRIGHMGDHTMDGLDGLLDVLAEVLKP
ncbi:MAG TPA: alanine--glyoxylate aminotransferase family protein [Longimicrobiales bacterium]|nr:alanine--glyoxylate aminotransferase family protein [Longimicrobiales bacterium]